MAGGANGSGSGVGSYDPTADGEPVRVELRYGHKYLDPAGRRMSQLCGYDLPYAVENAIYQENWDVVRGWAVTTALTNNDAGFVKIIDQMIPTTMRIIAQDQARVLRTKGY